MRLQGVPGPPGPRGASEAGIWRTIVHANGRAINATGGAGHYWLIPDGLVPSGGANAGQSVSGLFFYDASDWWSHDFLTPEFRVRHVLMTNDVDPGVVTATSGLYPIQGISGNAGGLAITLGTVTAGSTIARLLTADVLRNESGEPFTLSSTNDVNGVLGIHLSAAIAANSFLGVWLELQARMVP